MLMRAVTTLLAAVFCAACAAPEDNPTRVHDLRVLGVQFDPPELMAPTCDVQNPTETLLPLLAVPIQMRALIADPAGEGRDIEWDVRACAWTGDTECKAEFDSLEVKRIDGTAARGTVKGGEELSFSFLPATLVLEKRQVTAPDGTRRPQHLLEQVQAQDVFRGFGGLRLPVVLHLKAGDEEIFAQKLMVFSCKLPGAQFEATSANVTPVLPGLRLVDEPWPETPVRELSGDGPFKIDPEDFSALEEPYIVPSFELDAINLEESWVLAWHTTYGRMSAHETGGTDPDGETSRHLVEWLPPTEREAKQVTFYVVVRDGRGGTSWLRREVNYTP